MRRRRGPTSRCCGLSLSASAAAAASAVSCGVVCVVTGAGVVTECCLPAKRSVGVRGDHIRFLVSRRRPKIVTHDVVANVIVAAITICRILAQRRESDRLSSLRAQSIPAESCTPCPIQPTGVPMVERVWVPVQEQPRAIYTIIYTPLQSGLKWPLPIAHRPRYQPHPQRARAAIAQALACSQVIRIEHWMGATGGVVAITFYCGEALSVGSHTAAHPSPLTPPRRPCRCIKI